MKITVKMPILLYFLIISFFACNETEEGSIKPGPIGSVKNEVDVWYTTADQTKLLEKQTTSLAFANQVNNYPTIEIDSTQHFQDIDGFGYTLTGGSAMLMSKMSSSEREKLLYELFECNENSLCISYLRISMGASDLDEKVFSYNDLESGQEDVPLSKFNLSYDTLYLIPILKSIVKINPNIKIMATPWSPPVWMKSNKQSVGGSLLKQFYPVYASYFVKYIRAMAQNNITIDAITIQNEPQHGGNNPSLVMSEQEQADFIKNHLGPVFKSEDIKTKIVVWDHNCDRPDYPISILNDAKAKTYIDGSAFHLYNGQISALSQVKSAHPDKNLYFTEQWTGAKGTFDGDLQWHIRNVIIGSMRNWSRIALEWNLANDPAFDPHTPGGCTECRGALTIDKSTVNRNVSYYIVGHASKFIPAGSKRITSNFLDYLPNAAFLTPNGKKVLIVLNEGNASELFNLGFKGKKALTHLPPKSVATFIW